MKLGDHQVSHAHLHILHRCMKDDELPKRRYNHQSDNSGQQECVGAKNAVEPNQDQKRYLTQLQLQQEHKHLSLLCFLSLRLDIYKNIAALLLDLDPFQ